MGLLLSAQQFWRHWTFYTYFSRGLPRICTHPWGRRKTQRSARRETLLAIQMYSNSVSWARNGTNFYP